MARWLIAGLIVVGLAIGIVMLWPGEGPVPPTTSQPVAVAEPTTTTSTSTTTTTLPQTTTTADPDSHIVETVDEAEEILRQLWFGWFEGIYHQDEDRIREVVITEEQVATARDSFGVEFTREPRPTDIEFSELEVLRSDKDCLAVWANLELSGFREGESPGVNVLRWEDTSWKRLAYWANRDDLWEEDCEAQLP